MLEPDDRKQPNITELYLCSACIGASGLVYLIEQCYISVEYNDRFPPDVMHLGNPNKSHKDLLSSETMS